MATPSTNPKSAGDKLVEKILADLREQRLQPDSREAELLERARAMADRIEELETLVAVEGMTYTDKSSVVRPTPLLSEIRQSTIVLTRCLNAIQFNDEPSHKDPTKQRAGRASWAARNVQPPARGVVR
jgi:hypothetical protein